MGVDGNDDMIDVSDNTNDSIVVCNDDDTASIDAFNLLEGVAI